ncbi:hypothetical protein [Iningainema tapete]|uniref:Uncharacterized protein n=1 Tax=Iningainema tapete BLCC-T55 TaxID=2748662 RepID=A0A8J6XN02_9CYAN|nr:hypothetical protein [Iningainema tapete]MBD2774006.1 hypothetical protein [Iningainema tapete BLCC-T55]
MLSTNWRGYRVAAWVGQALLTIFVIAAAVQGNWQNAFALACFLVASVAFVVMDDPVAIAEALRQFLSGASAYSYCCVCTFESLILLRPTM